MKQSEIIQLLLNHLPDSNFYNGDDCWDWCWNELSDEAQEAVKDARQKAMSSYDDSSWCWCEKCRSSDKTEGQSE